MLENLSEIIAAGDDGNVDAMIEFVNDYELICAAKNEVDIRERRHTYLLKLVEEKIPFAYEELAFEYEDSGEFDKAIKLFEKSCKYGNTFSLEHLGKYYYFGDHIKQDYKKAFELFSKASKEEGSDEENVEVSYPFVAHLFLGEMYRKGLFVEKDNAKASKHYGDSCWLSIQGYEPESDEMAIAAYWNGLERLGKISDGEYSKNTVEAIAMLELAADWEFADEALPEKLGISKDDIKSAYEECKDEIKKLYPDAKYIAVNAGKYIIAKAEEFNQVMDFEDDMEARDYVAEYHDDTNGDAESSVKFVLNTKTWETLYSDEPDMYQDEEEDE